VSAFERKKAPGDTLARKIIPNEFDNAFEYVESLKPHVILNAKALLHKAVQNTKDAVKHNFTCLKGKVAPLQ